MNVGHVEGAGGVEPTPRPDEKTRSSAAREARDTADEAHISDVSKEALKLENRVLLLQFSDLPMKSLSLERL